MFGENFDENFYYHCLNLCELVHDINEIKEGDKKRKFINITFMHKLFFTKKKKTNENSELIPFFY